VIVVGEMRDPETMRIALAAGRNRPPGIVDAAYERRDVHGVAGRGRLSGRAPPTIRQELAMALAAGDDPGAGAEARRGRVPAVELMIVGYGARQHIRKNALQHLHQEITINTAGRLVHTSKSASRNWSVKARWTRMKLEPGHCIGKS